MASTFMKIKMQQAGVKCERSFRSANVEGSTCTNRHSHPAEVPLCPSMSRDEGNHSTCLVLIVAQAIGHQADQNGSIENYGYLHIQNWTQAKRLSLALLQYLCLTYLLLFRGSKNFSNILVGTSILRDRGLPADQGAFELQYWIHG